MFLGFDGGGSKTEAVILDDRGLELGRGRGGPCNLHTCGLDALIASVLEARDAAAGAADLKPSDANWRAACVGVAGFSARQKRLELEKALTREFACRVRVESDYRVALAGAASAGAGVVVIAGTGSIVYGESPTGQSVRVGGRGYLLNDPGSGFWLGALAMRRTLERLDRAESPDDFDHRLLSRIGVDRALSGGEQLDALVEWVNRDFHPSRVAVLASSIGEWAAAGDRVASELLDRAAGALADQVRWVTERLALSEPGPLFALGGLWGISGLLARFENAVGREVTAAKHDPAHGAALLARK